MKSNGKELKIHVSKEAHAELIKTNEFEIDYRGKVYLKGRGDMDCYWLKACKKPITTGMQNLDVQPSFHARPSFGALPTDINNFNLKFFVNTLLQQDFFREDTQY